jgi:hypothetical protein
MESPKCDVRAAAFPTNKIPQMMWKSLIPTHMVYHQTVDTARDKRLRMENAGRMNNMER